MDIKIVLGSTFTLGLLENLSQPLHTEESSWDEIESIANVFNICDEDEVEVSFIAWGEPIHFHAINSFGHKSTCDLIASRMDIYIRDNRISLCLDEGWTIFIPQYVGKRLEEGVTVLPNGAKLEPVKVVLGEDEEKIALRRENALLRAKIKEMEDFLRHEGYFF